MSHAIRLSDAIYNEAQRYAKIEKRSVPKQIEHWSKIGRIAEKNPDLTYKMIKDILFSMDQAKSGDISKYKFS